MTTVRLFRPDDLLKFNNVNLDVLTETYNMPFYFHYMAKWPELFVVGKAPDQATIMGYIMGKVEGSEAKETLHGHVTALTVAPQFRRLNLAQRFMQYLEDVSERPPNNSFFVDLFVRVSNQVAIDMYSKLGYSVYRRVLGYYSGEEDAFGKLNQSLTLSLI
jgi:N-terminal acetyltransferase B complex catalytic subunit